VASQGFDGASVHFGRGGVVIDMQLEGERAWCGVAGRPVVAARCSSQVGRNAAVGPAIRPKVEWGGCLLGKSKRNLGWFALWARPKAENE
jgi:hypothetical protein